MLTLKRYELQHQIFFKIVEIGATPWSRFEVVDYYQNPFIGVKKKFKPYMTL